MVRRSLGEAPQEVDAAGRAAAGAWILHLEQADPRRRVLTRSGADVPRRLPGRLRRRVVEPRACADDAARRRPRCPATEATGRDGVAKRIQRGTGRAVLAVETGLKARAVALVVETEDAHGGDGWIAGDCAGKLGVDLRLVRL